MGQLTAEKYWEQISLPFAKKCLTTVNSCDIMAKLCENAAIAQPVERILGKDEVASSNLASSSKKRPKPFGFGHFLELLAVNWRSQ